MDFFVVQSLLDLAKSDFAEYFGNHEIVFIQQVLPCYFNYTGMFNDRFDFLIGLFTDLNFLIGRSLVMLIIQINYSLTVLIS